MAKRISRIGLGVLFGTWIAAFCYPVFVQAAGIYKLEYPQGYGCYCRPNSAEFGYFRSAWRKWPGETRRDKTFPRSISSEVLPAPEGQEVIPPPKVTVEQLRKEAEEPPPPSPEGEAMPPQENLLPQENLPGQEMPQEPPAEKPAEPGVESPTLPQSPNATEEFNPLPSLPSDSESNPKPEDNKKSDSPDKDKTTSSSKTVPESDRTSILQPGVNAGSLLAIKIHSSGSIQPVTYHESSEAAVTAIPAESSDDLPQKFSVALDGYCPVELGRYGRWTQGDQRWSIVYKGIAYRFSGNAQRQEFLANPEKYRPANDGCDPVISVAENRNVPGQVNYCAAYKGRIYMFSSAATQEYFHKNPELYVSRAKK